MNYNSIKEATNNKFSNKDFKQGDIFSEMLSHWKVIIKVDGDRLTLITGSSQNLKLEKINADDFVKLCSYKNIPGYWIDFMKNDTGRAQDYLEAYCEQQNMSIDEVRDMKLDLVL